MKTVTVDDIKSFAERVERLCEFLLQNLERDGSDDVVAIQKIQEDAADLQCQQNFANVSIDGLSSYIRGYPPVTTQ